MITGEQENVKNLTLQSMGFFEQYSLWGGIRPPPHNFPKNAAIRPKTWKSVKLNDNYDNQSKNMRKMHIYRNIPRFPRFSPIFFDFLRIFVFLITFERIIPKIWLTT